jgi:hypothetical protein
VIIGGPLTSFIQRTCFEKLGSEKHNSVFDTSNGSLPLAGFRDNRGIIRHIKTNRDKSFYWKLQFLNNIIIIIYPKKNFQIIWLSYLLTGGT